jgi:Flp pilus assembly protein TadD
MSNESENTANPINVATPLTATRVQFKLLQAYALHQQGQLAKAQTIYLEVLRLQPDNADSLHLLGMVASPIWMMRRLQ